MKKGVGIAGRSVRLPEGVRDFLPRAAARRQTILDTLSGTFSRFGYELVRTPVFEVAEVLERGLGADARNSTIHFVEPGTGEEVALRPDITPQVARMAATRFATEKGPTRLCYQGIVVRSQRGVQGQKEVLQAGAELFGVAGELADVEILSLAAAVLEATGVSERGLELGHVALVRWALAALPDEEMRAELKIALSSKDRFQVRDIAKSLPMNSRSLIELLPRLYGSPADVFSMLENQELPDEIRKVISYLSSLVTRLSDVVGEETAKILSVDLGDARGFDYYTGIRLFGYLGGVGTAALVGGRYDSLTKSYGREMPSIGFALDVEGVAIAQGDSNSVAPRNPLGILVEGESQRASRVASSLRKFGMRATAQLGGELSKEELLNYARRCGFRSVLLLAEKSEILEDISVEKKLVESAEMGNGTELGRFIESRWK